MTKTRFHAGRRIIHLALILMGFALLVPAAPSQASGDRLSEEMKFEIPAQPLSTALVQFSKQAAVQVVTSSVELGTLETRGVSGKLSITRALEALLDKTGLKYSLVGENTVAIRISDAGQVGQLEAGSAHRTTLADSASSSRNAQTTEGWIKMASSEDAAAQSGNGASTTQEQEELQVVTVLSKRMAMERNVEGAKLPIRLLELPQSVTVIDRELMNDQNVVELQDALRNAGGVMPGGYFEGFDFYRIRGFDASGFTLLDGLLADQTFWTQEELFGMEQVEVLKGPGSGLYGQAPAGGLVNLVSKRPQKDRFLRAMASLGSHNYYDVGIDGNTELSDRVAFRLNSIYRVRGSFVDHVPVAKRFFAAPSLKWNIGDATSITFLTQFIDEKTGLAQPLPAEGTVLPNPAGRLPITRAIGEPTLDDSADIQRKQAGWDFTHNFNDVLSFHQVTRASEIDVDFHAIYPWYLDTDLRTLNRYVRAQKVRADAYAADNQLIARLHGGSVKHTIVSGLDWYKFDQKQGFRYYGFGGEFAPIDIFNPQYGTPVPDLQVTTLRPTKLKRTGIYLQDHIKLTDRFTALLGGRYDWTDDGTTEDKKFTPRLGATYEFIPGAAVFVSYSRSFMPQAGLETVDLEPLPPETGEQYEVGLKTELFNDRLTGTLSVYELTRQNIATDDPNSEEYFFVTTGEQRSRGVELDGIVRFSSTWELAGNITYTDAEITKDTDLVVGSPTVNVPKFGLALWTKYVVPAGPMRGAALSFGARHYNKQAGDSDYNYTDEDTFDLPSYTVVDAGVSYPLGPYMVRFNVSNLTNERYFPASYSKTFVMPGEPRTYRLAVEYGF